MGGLYPASYGRMLLVSLPVAGDGVVACVSGYGAAMSGWFAAVGEPPAVTLRSGRWGPRMGRFCHRHFLLSRTCCCHGFGLDASVLNQAR